MRKLFILSVLTILSTSSFAKSDEKPSPEKFAKAKEMLLKNIDEKITSLNENKTCVSAATNQEEMRVCREKMKEKIESRRQGRKKKIKMKKENKADS